MAFRPKRSTPLLRDLYSLLCGACGRRIEKSDLPSSGEFDYHHIDQQQVERRLAQIVNPARTYAPVTTYDWKQFVVPVHRACHAGLDAYSGAIANAVLSSYKADPTEVEYVARHCFDAGEFPLAVRLHQRLGRHFTEIDQDDDRLRQQLQFELVCAAGLWFFDCPNIRDFLSALPPDLKLNPMKHPHYSMFLLNPFCSFGVEGASKLLHEVRTGLRNGGTNSLKAKALRLEGILSFQLNITRQAETMSEQYAELQQQVTSVLNTVWAFVNENQDQKAFDELHKIEDRIHGTSWYRYFQINFARGSVPFMEGDHDGLKRALIALLRAQFVMAAKGFRGWAVPDVRKPNRPVTKALYPVDVLNWLINRHKVPKERMDELRQIAISPHLINQLWTAFGVTWRTGR